MNWHLETFKFTPEIAKTFIAVVQGSVEVFKEVQNYLKPTPAKCHYVFNVRDLSRVIQGIQMINKEDITSSDKTL